MPGSSLDSLSLTQARAGFREEERVRRLARESAHAHARAPRTRTHLQALAHLVGAEFFVWVDIALVIEDCA